MSILNDDKKNGLEDELIFSSRLFTEYITRWQFNESGSTPWKFWSETYCQYWEMNLNYCNDKQMN